MKTAATIEAQEERKKAEKGANSSRSSTTCSGPGSEKPRRGRIENLKPWKPGQTGNPAGKNGWQERRDLAAEIARAIFENDGPAIYAAFAKVLRKGSPYGFQVLADRAFGKLKEVHQIEHSPYKDMSDEDIEKRIEELKRKLGWPGSEPQLSPPADETKPN
jgi:hypothetical protein